MSAGFVPDAAAHSVPQRVRGEPPPPAVHPNLRDLPRIMLSYRLPAYVGERYAANSFQAPLGVGRIGPGEYPGEHAPNGPGPTDGALRIRCFPTAVSRFKVNVVLALDCGHAWTSHFCAHRHVPVWP